MKIEINVTDSFKKAAKPLIKKYPSFLDDLSELESQLLKDPETGKPIQGFKVEFTTGDVMLIPAGQAVSINDPQDKIPGQVVIGGSSRTYQIDGNGQTSEDMITMRYASVFCSRQL